MDFLFVILNILDIENDDIIIDDPVFDNDVDMELEKESDSSFSQTEIFIFDDDKPSCQLTNLSNYYLIELFDLKLRLNRFSYSRP